MAFSHAKIPAMRRFGDGRIGAGAVDEAPGSACAERLLPTGISSKDGNPYMRGAPN